MTIISFEPTPSPNVMKLLLANRLPDKIHFEFTRADASHAPDWLQTLLQIDGVKYVYATADFIALERVSDADWKAILAHVPGITEVDLQLRLISTLPIEGQNPQVHLEREFQVEVQMIQEIPIQVKLRSESQEYRFAMPQEFVQQAVEASRAGDNLIRDRVWVPRGARYGVADSLGSLIVEEEAARFSGLDQASIAQMSGEHDFSWERFSTWQEKFNFLAKLLPDLDNLPLLLVALKDAHPSVRRLAVVCLADLKDGIVFAYLFKALRDSAVSVRRTAGDALSDLGDPIAIPYMIDALQDEHRLMRWRAARYLFEIGDERALPALEKAIADSEFEVALQAKLAMERIRGGQDASGTMWQQIANRSKNVQ